jgi:hypothetical protein
MGLEPIPPAASALSVVTITCAAVAATVTLLWAGAFPAPTGHTAANTVLAEARGWSAVTLFFVLPLATGSLVRALRGSMRGRLTWIGSLAYFVYTYLEFAVSPPFTALYLVYIVAFACAIPALVMAAASIEVRPFADAFGRQRPRRTVAAFALLFSVFLSLAWLKGIVSRTLAASFGWPEGDDAVGHVVHALDLGLQVPLGIATAVLLLRGRPSGFLVGATFLVVAVCMGCALTAMVAWHATVAGEPVSQAVPFAFLSAVALLIAAAYFRVPG